MIHDTRADDAQQGIHAGGGGKCAHDVGTISAFLYFPQVMQKVPGWTVMQASFGMALGWALVGVFVVMVIDEVSLKKVRDFSGAAETMD